MLKPSAAKSRNWLEDIDDRAAVAYCIEADRLGSPHWSRGIVMFKIAAIVTAAVIVAAPAAAQNSAPLPGAPAATSKAKDPNRVICERQEEIGSRLGGKKVCKTAAEWQLEREQNRQTLEGVQ